MADYQNSDQEPERAGALGLVISFLFPIIGFILAFAQKNAVENSEAYAKAAGFGVFFWIFIRRVMLSL